jgi:ABC-type multidrug transport system permease subunit
MTRWHAFGQLILARLREFFREPEAIFWVYAFPLILAVALGLAFSGGPQPPPAVDVQGPDSDRQVAHLVKVLRDGGLKEVEAHDADLCRKRLTTGKTALYVVPHEQGLEYVYDEARAECVLARHQVDAILLRHQLGDKSPKTADTQVTEPGSRYIDFLLPGLIGTNLMGGGLFGVGFVLVDMRVRKLFKRLLATPMNRVDFLLALLTARLVFLVPEVTVLLGVGALALGVPVKGGLLTLAVVILCGNIAFDGIGLLIACRTEKTETISGLINLVMLPMYLLSGVFFSSKRFPAEVQPYLQVLPLTQLNDALREVMLEGHGLGEVAWRLGILLAWGLGTFALALRWFRWR